MHWDILNNIINKLYSVYDINIKFNDWNMLILQNIYINININKRCRPSFRKEYELGHIFMDFFKEIKYIFLIKIGLNFQAHIQFLSNRVYQAE